MREDSYCISGGLVAGYKPSMRKALGDYPLPPFRNQQRCTEMPHQGFKLQDDTQPHHQLIVLK